jgi:nucleoid DNA-binding protein
MMIVRENTEGEYSAIGGRMYPGTEREVVVQETVMSRVGVDRILKFAFELAQSRPKKHLTSATKSNGIAITMPYWDERVEAMAAGYPEVRVDRYHIDILTAHFVQRPQIFDTVVASNLFGDILSDLGPACTGTIGIAPSANINPTREHPSLFEPVHGSAPDIAGQGIANPIGQVWSAALMLDFLGHREAHDAIIAAIEVVLEPSNGGPRTAIWAAARARRTSAARSPTRSRRRALHRARRAVKHLLHERRRISSVLPANRIREPCLTLQIHDAVIVSPRRALALPRRTHRILLSQLPEGETFVNKSELIEHIARQADISKAAASRALEAVIGGVKTSLKKNNAVSLVGFGTFTVGKRAARSGRNPRTGAAIKIKAAKVPKFRPGKALKDALN